MKVYVTGATYIAYHKKRRKERFTIHFYSDCQLLNHSESGIEEIELSFIPNIHHAYEPFEYNNQTVFCCPKCSPRLFPNLFNYTTLQEIIREEKGKVLRTFKK